MYYGGLVVCAVRVVSYGVLVGVDVKWVGEGEQRWRNRRSCDRAIILVSLPRQRVLPGGREGGRCGCGHLAGCSSQSSWR